MKDKRAVDGEIRENEKIYERFGKGYERLQGIIERFDGYTSGRREDTRERKIIRAVRQRIREVAGDNRAVRWLYER
ncbi:hypothetical protein [Sporosarcina cyprini]|uniref:hypothetical protein n=1 Tax=Sporosarcina cyprini TaxID=2910523 RepID=UPI001EDED6B3|nr:hypothetical protein [Sporosarcina cyprini]MCG3089049.1 hypothetical protein [Sporosarcina cyprini]